MEELDHNDTKREVAEPHFGDRLNELLDLAGIPQRGRRVWLEREFDLSKSTPGLWLAGRLPRHDTLKEVAALLNELAQLDEPPNVTEHWLMTGKRPNQNDKQISATKNDCPELDHYTKSLILKDILRESAALDIDLHTLDRNYVNQIINRLNVLILKKGEDFLGSNEFKAILIGQLEQARQEIL